MSEVIEKDNNPTLPDNKIIEPKEPKQSLDDFSKEFKKLDTIIEKLENIEVEPEPAPAPEAKKSNAFGIIFIILAGIAVAGYLIFGKNAESNKDNTQKEA